MNDSEIFDEIDELYDQFKLKPTNEDALVKSYNDGGYSYYLEFNRQLNYVDGRILKYENIKR